MDGLQAAILNTKLKHIHNWTDKRQNIAKLYSQKLNGLNNVVTPVIRQNSTHSFHLYVIQAENRDGLKKHLFDNGVETAIHYPTPLPLLEAYQYLGYQNSEFPVAYILRDKILSLPIYPEMSIFHVSLVCDLIYDFYRKDGKQ